jgi:hypothetical protein
MSTLDQIRANLKAGKPHVVTSVATPRATSTSASSKTDPLAAIRAKVKGSKPATPATDPNALLKSESNTGARLARLEKVVNAIALTLPAAQLTTLKADIAAITGKTTNQAQ